MLGLFLFLLLAIVSAVFWFRHDGLSRSIELLCILVVVVVVVVVVVLRPYDYYFGGLTEFSVNSRSAIRWQVNETLRF